MGNSKSSAYEHEKLGDETDDRYFARIEARNRIKTRDMTIPPPKPLTKKNRRVKRLLASPFKSSSGSKSRKDDATVSAAGSPSLDPSPSDVSTARSRAARSERASTDPSPADLSLAVAKKDRRRRPRGSSTGVLPGPRSSSDRRRRRRSTPAGGDGRKSRRATRRSRSSSNDPFSDVGDALTHGAAVVVREIVRDARVTCVSLDPSSGADGAPPRLAVGHEDGSVVVGTLSGTTEGEPLIVERALSREGRVRSLHWSPDGARLAVGGNDCAAAVLDAATGEVSVVCEREDRVYAVRWDPRGERLAVGGFDGMVAVVERSSGRVLTEIPRLGLVLALAWSPDGRYLAVGGSDRRAAVVDADDWEVVGEVARPGSVRCVGWCPASGSDDNDAPRRLAVGGHDGAVAVVDVDSRSVVVELRTSGPASASAWSSDGAFLAVAGDDGACAVYETATHEKVSSLSREGAVSCVDWVGTWLAVGGDDKTVAVVKTGSSSRYDDDRTETSSVSTAMTDVTGDDASVPDWVGASAFEPRPEGEAPSEESAVHATAFSERHVAVARGDDEVLLLDAATLAVVRSLPRAGRVLLPHPDGERLLVAGPKGSPTSVYSASNGALSHTLDDDPATTIILAAAYAPDGSLLVTGDAEGLLRSYDAASGAPRGVGDGVDAPVRSLDWSPDGSELAVGRDDASCALHDRADVEEDFWIPRTELRRDSSVTAVAFSKTGSFLAVGGRDWTVAIYEQSGDDRRLVREVRTDGWISDLRWSRVADDRMIVGGTFGALFVHARDDEWAVSPLEAGHGEETRCVEWSYDGTIVATAGTGGTVRLSDAQQGTVLHELDKDWKGPTVAKEREEASDDHNNNDVEGKTRSLTTPVLSQDPAQHRDPGTESDESSSNDESSSSSSTNDPFTVESSTAHLLRKNSSSDDSHSSSSNRRRHRPRHPHSDAVVSHLSLPLARFLRTCDAFLAPYDFSNPPPVLRTFHALMLNLQAHVRRLRAAPPDITRRAAAHPGLPVVRRLLESAVVVADEMAMGDDAAEDDDVMDGWWRSKDKFDLERPDLSRLRDWNEWWRDNAGGDDDDDHVSVDLELLRRVDEIDDTEERRSEAHLAYHSIGEEEEDEPRPSARPHDEEEERRPTPSPGRTMPLKLEGGPVTTSLPGVNDEETDDDTWALPIHEDGFGGEKGQRGLHGDAMHVFSNETDDSTSSYSSSEEGF